MTMNLENRLLNVLKENVDLGESEIEKLSLESDLGVLGLNSVTFIKLIVALEGEFDIEFEDSHLDYGKFTNLKSIAEYIEAQMNLSA